MLIWFKLGAAIALRGGLLINYLDAVDDTGYDAVFSAPLIVDIMGLSTVTLRRLAAGPSTIVLLRSASGDMIGSVKVLLKSSIAWRVAWLILERGCVVSAVLESKLP